MNELALFSGAGGGILGGTLLGWRTVCAVEWEPYPASVLCARQNDGILPAFPVWDDVQTFDGRPWRGIAEVVSGGFPCTDISAAGKGAGIEGEASSMWKHMARIIGEVLPQLVFVENSPLLVGRGAAMVIGDLAALGYDARWACISTSDCGAPHKRDRFWLVADAERNASDKRFEFHMQRGRAGEAKQTWLGGFAKNVVNPVSNGLSARGNNHGEYDRHQPCATDQHASEMADAMRDGLQRRGSDRRTERSAGLCDRARGNQKQHLRTAVNGWPVEPDVGRVVNELAFGMDITGANEA